MLVTRNNPAVFFSHLNRLSDEMDRAFAHAAGDDSGVRVPLDLYSDADAVHVEVELPGFAAEDVEITVTGENQLSIRGSRGATEGEELSWHRRERRSGEFQRLIELPELVDSTAVEATFRDGVLTINLPKREEAKPRRIEVKVG